MLHEGPFGRAVLVVVEGSFARVEAHAGAVRNHVRSSGPVPPGAGLKRKSVEHVVVPSPVIF